MSRGDVASEPKAATKRLRILAILNGSWSGGFSGGDFHTVAVLNEWAVEHQVELYLPRGSSPEIIELLSPGVRVQTRSESFPPPSRLRYLLSVTARMLVATSYILRRRASWDVVIANSHFITDTLP